METARAVNQQHAVVVLDQAVYAKAAEIVWKQPQELRGIVLRMGAFHNCTTFLAVIGKRFSDASLRDLMFEARIVGPYSAARVLAGKHYNRGVRACKIVAEALNDYSGNAFRIGLNSRTTVAGPCAC